METALKREFVSPDNVFFKREFLCESSKDKINFMRTNGGLTDGDLAFKDVAHMDQDTAPTWGSGGERALPWVMIFIAGFVCKAVSRLNKNHAKFKGSVKAKKGDTSKTFWGCYKYIAKHMISLAKRSILVAL